MAQLQLFPATETVATSGDADLVRLLDEVVLLGFPARRPPPGVKAVKIHWNGRLRSTVGRVLAHPEHPVIEISPKYHDTYRDELMETVAHEFAHVLHPGRGHGRDWRDELEAALRNLSVPIRPDLIRARHAAPTKGRYVWLCSTCEEAVAVRSRRCREEVASFSTCCRAPIEVFDAVLGSVAPERPFQVCCPNCAMRYVAYETRHDAERFARTHRCRCGSVLALALPA